MRSDIEREDQVCSQSWDRRTEVQLSPKFGSIIAPECNYDRESSGLGGCFLTTACIEYAGLPDDCRELQVMRHFRDNYIRNLSEGDSALSEYYQTAPLIVKGIKSRVNSKDIFRHMLNTLRNVVNLVESERHDEARTICKEEFIALKSKYLRD